MRMKNSLTINGHELARPPSPIRVVVEEVFLFVFEMSILLECPTANSTYDDKVHSGRQFFSFIGVACSQSCSTGDTPPVLRLIILSFRPGASQLVVVVLYIYLYIYLLSRAPRGRVHLTVGVLIICLILFLIVSLFNGKPVVDEHEEIRQRTMAVARSKNFEWVPIENVDVGVWHHSSHYVLSLYRVVIAVMIMQCDPQKVQALLESVVMADYRKKLFPVDIHVEFRCPAPETPAEKTDQEKVQDLITSLRWTNGRVTGHRGPPIKGAVEYVMDSWLPVTNWEVTLFVEEGSVLDRNWFIWTTQGMKDLAIRKGSYVLPRRNRGLAEEEWRLTYTLEDLTPRHFLGFFLGDPEAEAEGQAYAMQRLANGMVIVPGKWSTLKKALVDWTKDKPITDGSGKWLQQQVRKALEEQELYLVHIGAQKGVSRCLVCSFDNKALESTDPSDIIFPPLSNVPLFDARDGRIADKHFFIRAIKKKKKRITHTGVNNGWLHSKVEQGIPLRDGKCVPFFYLIHFIIIAALVSLSLL
eukprot:gene7385-5199_t